MLPLFYYSAITLDVLPSCFIYICCQQKVLFSHNFWNFHNVYNTKKNIYLLVVMRILKDKIITEINGQRTTQHINATCRPQNSLLSSFNLEKSLCKYEII